MNSFSIDRRTLFVGVGAAAMTAVSPAQAKNKRQFVINALGGLRNPNGGRYTDAMVAAHHLDKRAINEAKDAGLAGVNLTLGHVFGDGDPFYETVDSIAWWREAIRIRPNDLVHVLTAKDLRKAHKSRKVGMIFGFQNSEMFAGDASRVRLFSDLGVRVVQLTYNLQGTAGDGALVPENKGLTDFGRDLVGALNDHNMLVDVSHAGERTTLDAIAISEKPIAITHTGCAALAPHPRNRGDAELRAMADKGGVMGVYFMPYLTPGRQQMAADIVAHIEHAVNVCGEDHVGLGTDGGTTGVDDMPAFLEEHKRDIENRARLGVGAPNEQADIITIPPDLMGPTQFERLSDMLKARGHSSKRIDKILGGNFMRLFDEIW